MSGRSYRAEREITVAAFERIDRLESAAGREQSRLPRRGGRAGVAVEATTARGTEPLEMIEVRGGVHALELASRGPPGLEPVARVGGSARIQAVEDRPYPGRSLGVTTAGVVLLEVCVRRDQ